MFKCKHCKKEYEDDDMWNGSFCNKCINSIKKDLRERWIKKASEILETKKGGENE